MNYEIFYDPIAHVVIDNFFDQTEYDILFDCIQKIEEHMSAGSVINYNVTGNFIKSTKNIIKRNFNFWPHLNSDEASTMIEKIIQEKLWSEEMRRVYVSVKDSNFQYFHFANQSTILVSKYTKNSYYDWHFDTCATVTPNMMISKDEVIGGNFIMKNIFGEIKEVQYKNNRCVLFPSLCSHKVTEVENDCSRYSIQYFSSTNLENGVRDE